MKKAQQQAVTGRKSSPSSDQLDTEFQKLKRQPHPETASYQDMVKHVRGGSKREPEPYFTVDASVYSDIAKAMRRAGVIPRGRETKQQERQRRKSLTPC